MCKMGRGDYIPFGFENVRLLLAPDPRTATVDGALARAFTLFAGSTRVVLGTAAANGCAVDSRSR